MEHHQHDPKDIPGLPPDAVRLAGPPAYEHGGWTYTYHSDTFKGVWSVIFQDGQKPWVIYQPPIGNF